MEPGTVGVLVLADEEFGWKGDRSVPASSRWGLGGVGLGIVECWSDRIDRDCEGEEMAKKKKIGIAGASYMMARPWSFV